MNLRYPGYLDTLGNILVTYNNYDIKRRETQVWCSVRIYIGWCLLVLGDDSTTQELLLNDDGKKVRIAELYHAENGIKFGVRSWVHTIKRNQCYSRGKSSLEEFSIPVLNLVDDVSTWLPGNPPIAAPSLVLPRHSLSRLGTRESLVCNLERDDIEYDVIEWTS